MEQETTDKHYVVIPKKIVDIIHTSFIGNTVDAYLRELNDFIKNDLARFDARLWYYYDDKKREADERRNKIPIGKIPSTKNDGIIKAPMLRRALNMGDSLWGVCVTNGKTYFLDVLCYFSDKGKDPKEARNWSAMLKEEGLIRHIFRYRNPYSELTPDIRAKLKENNFMDFTRKKAVKQTLGRYSPFHNIPAARPIATEAEFSAIDTLYQNSFKEYSVPTSVLYSWWQEYPNGLLCATHNDKIIAGLSMWPIDRNTLDGLKTGKIRERDIESQVIGTSDKQFWYLSDIARINDLTKRQSYDCLTVLLTKAFSIFKQEIGGKFPVIVSAEGLTEEGIGLLEKRGFSREEKTKDGLPLFTIIIKSFEDLMTIRETVPNLTAL